MKISEKMKKKINTLSHYSLIIIGIIVSFIIGFYYNEYKSISNIKTSSYIKRNDVKIAIDEYNNIMIINKDGTYTILEDSIGKTIFDLYAKNIYLNNKQEIK